MLGYILLLKIINIVNDVRVCRTLSKENYFYIMYIHYLYWSVLQGGRCLRLCAYNELSAESIYISHTYISTSILTFSGISCQGL